MSGFNVCCVYVYGSSLQHNNAYVDPQVKVSAQYIVLAVGGRPKYPKNVSLSRYVCAHAFTTEPHCCRHPWNSFKYPNYRRCPLLGVVLYTSLCTYSLVPRLLGGGEKRAWYTLFAHALNHDDIPSFLYIFVHVRARRCHVTSQVYFVPYLDYCKTDYNYCMAMKPSLADYLL